MQKNLIIIMLIAALLVMSCAATYETEEPKQVPQQVTEEVTSQPVAPIETETSSTPAATPEEPVVPVVSKGTLEGVDKSSEVVGYRVKGRSAEGDNFDWIEVKSHQIVLSNITQGHWTLDVEAIDKDGNVLYSGQIVRELSKETEGNGEAVSFVKNQSNGCAKVVYRWNAALVNSPELEVWVKNINGTEYQKCRSEEIEFSIGEATWTNASMPTGSYIVKAILKDSGYVISGVASTLNIYENLESTGSATFHVNPFVASFDFSSLNAAPVDISLNPEGKTIVASGDDLSYTWFIDGVESNNSGKVFDISQEVGHGRYRIDCIATDGNTVCSKHIFINYINDSALLASEEGV